MMLRVKNNKRGQTALEYALVIGVICIGVIVLGKTIFGDKDGPAHQLMGNAITAAGKTIENRGE